MIAIQFESVLRESSDYSQEEQEKRMESAQRIAKKYLGQIDNFTIADLKNNPRYRKDLADFKSAIDRTIPIVESNLTQLSQIMRVYAARLNEK